MADIAEQHIFLLDDEPEVCQAVSETLEERGLAVSHFTRAADCLEELHSQRCDLLITDMKMPEMDGIELLAEVKRLAPWIPVLVITGYGDIPTAVTAMKAGAVDFIEKPLDRESFLHKITSILRQSPSSAYTGKALTETETRVLKFLLQGKSNKEISLLLKRSIRTIEVHRAHLMHKLAVDNLVDLIKQAVAMGLVRLPAKRQRPKAGEDAQEQP